MSAIAEPDPANPDVTPVGPAAGHFIPFADVLRDELRLIEERRKAVDGGAASPILDERSVAANADAELMKLRVEALRGQTTGLSFSGGGIRAGTFAVGILQGLGTLGLLRRFDYLSTVSGGGYAGGWLAAWLKRQGNVQEVETQLNPSRVDESRSNRTYLAGQVVDEEPEPIRHLRAYSSYLTPQPGLLTADTWTVIAIWGRNVIINLMMLLPLAMLVVIAGRGVVYFYNLMNQVVLPNTWSPWILGLAVLIAAFFCLGYAFWNNGAALAEFRKKDPRLRPARIEANISRRVVYPLMAASVLMTIAARRVLWNLSDLLAAPGAGSEKSSMLSGQLWDMVASHLGLLELPNFTVHFLLLGLMFALGATVIGLRDKTLTWRFFYSSFLAGGSGGLLFVLLEALIREFAVMDRPDLMATFAPPLGLSVIVMSLIVAVALLGDKIEESEREWWARFGALNLIMGLLWMAAMASILYVPGLFLASGPVLQALLTSGWVGSAAFAVISGKSVLPKSDSGGGGLGLQMIASLASIAFLVGMIGLISLVAASMVNIPAIGSPFGDGLGPFAHYVEGIKGTSIWILLVVAFASYIAFRLAQGLIDVNLFSLNAMYANRLIRCYLGASRTRREWKARWADSPRDTRITIGTPATSDGVGTSDARDPNPVTGFDPRDDFDLIDLRIGKSRAGVDRPYWGPQLLINTTINLVGETDLARQDRKGESFLLSPLYCGSEGTGYAKLEDSSRTKLTLGRALSISGAAVDPNMSFYQSGPLTAMLTVFNARLGYWLETPKKDNWKADGPKFGNLLLTEFLGKTTERGEFVHISDGGHFENLGVYELIRRRCRYIVAVDSGEDSDRSNDNLSIMIRLCRIDFGVRIQVDTRPLEMSGPDKLTKTHVVIGRIRYDDVDQGEMPGVLVYVKISLTGDETPDLQKYARKSVAFPHEPTDLRQSFDEEQFECYRSLGEHIAGVIFGEAVERLGKAERSKPHDDYVPKLFSAVQSRWVEAPRPDDGRMTALIRGWAALHAEFIKTPALADLSRQLYPELPPPAEPVAADVRERAEVHAVNQMLAFLAEAWSSLELKEHPDLPGNRGWLNTFRRWTSTATIRKYWPMIRSEFHSDFVRFCETELHLTTAKPAAIALDGPTPDRASFEGQGLARLALEFALEWPVEVLSGRDLRERLDRARQLQAQLHMPIFPAWLIVQAPAGVATADLSAEKSVAGIVLAARAPLNPDQPDSAIEFLAWVRPAYRSAGLGSPTVREILDNHLLPALQQAHGGAAPKLWARYPRPVETASNNVDAATWLNFFARFDFRKFVPPGDGGRTSMLLVRDA